MRILRHHQRGGPAWSHSDTKDLSTAVSEGVEKTSEEWFLHTLVGSRRASIRLAGAPALVAGPGGNGAVGSALGPVVSRACLPFEKYEPGIRAATVKSPEESGHHLLW